MGNTPAVYYTYIEVNFILTMLLFQLIFLNNQYLNNVEYFRLTELNINIKTTAKYSKKNSLSTGIYRTPPPFDDYMCETK